MVERNEHAKYVGITTSKKEDSFYCVIDSNKALKVIKSFYQNNNKLYLRVQESYLYIRSIDVKEGLALLDAKIPLLEINQFTGLDLSIDCKSLIDVLENIKTKVRFNFNIDDNYLIAECAEKTNNNQYVLEYSSSKLESSYLDMALLDHIDKDLAYTTFIATTNNLLKISKEATTVGHTLCLIFVREEQTGAHKGYINTKEQKKLFLTPDLCVQNIITHLELNVDKTYQKYTLYYPQARISSLLKAQQDLTCRVYFFEEYMIITTVESTKETDLWYQIYIPLKKVEIL